MNRDPKPPMNPESETTSPKPTKVVLGGTMTERPDKGLIVRSNIRSRHGHPGIFAPWAT